MAPIEDGLPTAEVAKRLGVSNATVRNMYRDGRLKGFRPSGKGPLRIPETEVVRHQIETGQLGELAAPTELHPNLTPASSPAPPEPVVLAERAGEGVVHAA